LQKLVTRKICKIAWFFYRLNNETGIAGVPGEAFFHGADGNGLIRFCFAKEGGELDEACRRLGKLSI
jgi:aminotransferase